MTATYAIGTEYLTSGKYPRICTVVDVLTTTNSNGEIVKTRYVTRHHFAGQSVLDHDVCAVTIAKGADALKKRLAKLMAESKKP